MTATMALSASLVALTTEITLNQFLTLFGWNNENVIQSGEGDVVLEGGADVTKCDIVDRN